MNADSQGCKPKQPLEFFDLGLDVFPAYDG
jgi:hypothetical protein